MDRRRPPPRCGGKGIAHDRSAHTADPRRLEPPDALDQNPGDARPEDALGPRGSEDAQLIAEAAADPETGDD